MDSSTIPSLGETGQFLVSMAKTRWLFPEEIFILLTYDPAEYGLEVMKSAVNTPMSRFHLYLLLQYMTPYLNQMANYIFSLQMGQRNMTLFLGRSKLMLWILLMQSMIPIMIQKKESRENSGDLYES